MKPEELKAILDDHAKWLRSEGGKKANLAEANLSNANLAEADLAWANLTGADLATANLTGADLRGANLRGANLRWANLAGANLSNANLAGADLGGANLTGANLRGANLRGAKIDISICRMDFGRWSICVYADQTSIGCQTQSNEDWLSLTAESEEIKRMHRDASAWWAIHGEAIKGVIRCVMSKSKGGEA
jgi:hypothetical protein